MTADGLPAVTVLIDRTDHPNWTAAVHAAHDPAMGRLTVDPSPANGAPAALAHDLLYALGKRLPAAGETYGTSADSQRPAWDAVSAWILTHHIGHLIVCRTDRLTHARFRQLLALRERCGTRLTLLWHRPATPILRTLLEGTPLQIIDALPHARIALSRPGHLPTGPTSTGQHRPAKPLHRHDDGRWITPQRPPEGMVTDRPARTRCQAAPELSSAASGGPPPPGRGNAPEGVLAARLATVAHPLHATALAIHAVTGADIGQLALIRGIDINTTATTVKIHDSRAHQRCRLSPLPAWTSPLIHAAGIHGRLSDRSPDAPLLPLITIRHGQQLHLSAAGIHYNLDHPVRNDTSSISPAHS
ncbi:MULTISPECIES: hypothetical protein [unclassified Streptomyces]|uniref:hypothetical protein n=1 Tax=unclassified Streptomyces TaxID=2593676 RepID=UPI0029A0EB53|nr:MULTISPECIES: hypothetical protein [unclassified Streptomyces]MDX3772033.1 hypothetical protein [Streptomyces sp. AK08-01B]MDX3821558.1 hypothetical protein [Streptomyces sp. AK08-01A]